MKLPINGPGVEGLEKCLHGVWSVRGYISEIKKVNRNCIEVLGLVFGKEADCGRWYVYKKMALNVVRPPFKIDFVNTG